MWLQHSVLPHGKPSSSIHTRASKHSVCSAHDLTTNSSNARTHTRFLILHLRTAKTGLQQSAHTHTRSISFQPPPDLLKSGATSKTMRTA